MNMKFESGEIGFLRPVVWENQRQEQTQEIRLTDDLPDAGRVLGCWGQCILRSKEWRSGGMAASGGVMTWTLYAPEDGSEPRCLENWVPFQVKWNFPPTDTDGIMSVSCSIHGADARVVSARKLMLRVCVNVLGIGTCKEKAEVFKPGQKPDDVQLLCRTYPVTLPAEAGEKTVQLDEELELPGNAQDRKMLHCLIEPRILEQKIIGDRLVFRGSGKLQLLLWEDGQLRSESLDVPFSAFTDLDGEYSSEGSAQIQLALTALEAELMENGNLRLKASLAAQYIMWNRQMLDVVEDAWSPSRDVKLQQQILMLPTLLEHRVERCTAVGKYRQGLQALDAVCRGETVSSVAEDGRTVLRVPAGAQLLCREESGSLQGCNVQLEGQIPLDQEEGNLVYAEATETGSIQTVLNGEDVDVRCEVTVEIRTLSSQGITMVCGMELGEPRPADPDRPSLILRRTAGESLWELAKASGSSVDAIRGANNLENEPEAGRMLLIPVQ